MDDKSTLSKSVFLKIGSDFDKSHSKKRIVELSLDQTQDKKKEGKIAKTKKNKKTNKFYEFLEFPFRNFLP